MDDCQRDAEAIWRVLTVSFNGYLKLLAQIEQVMEIVVVQLCSEHRIAMHFKEL
jgi:hypothetical protein